MMKLLTDRTWIESSEFTREFEYPTEAGSGYCFDLGSDKLPIFNSEAGKDNWFGCISGEFNVVDLGVVERDTSHWQSAIGKCECGEQHSMDGDIHCKCGRRYNWCGQELRQYDDPCLHDDVDWGMEEEAMELDAIEQNAQY